MCEGMESWAGENDGENTKIMVNKKSFFTQDQQCVFPTKHLTFFFDTRRKTSRAWVGRFAGPVHLLWTPPYKKTHLSKRETGSQYPPHNRAWGNGHSAPFEAMNSSIQRQAWTFSPSLRSSRKLFHLDCCSDLPHWTESFCFQMVALSAWYIRWQPFLRIG